MQSEESLSSGKAVTIVDACSMLVRHEARTIGLCGKA